MANTVKLGEQPAGGSTCVNDEAHAISLSPNHSDKGGGNNDFVAESSTNTPINDNRSGDVKSLPDTPIGKSNDRESRKSRRNGTTRKKQIPEVGEDCSVQSSPSRGSNSAYNSSTAATSEEGTRRRSFSQNRYNSSPELGSENEDSLERIMVIKSKLKKVSVAVQTEYDEDYPPLSALQATGEDVAAMLLDMPDQQQLQPSSIVSIMPSSTSSSDLAAACSTSSDGTIQLIIRRFHNMTDTVRGPSKYVQHVPWRIMVMPRQHVVQKKGTQKCLGFFLQCCPEAYSDSWSCQASAELRLISQKTGVPNFTRKTNHVYTSKENDWGYSCFMTWADILDEQQGYLKEGKVILEVSVKADPPKNILSHKEFLKKIQEYKRLAEIQCQRGLIDKAIECNLQALKFCKDKDSVCKNELESQKALLIEMKLKQSIERIEKGSDQARLDDDGSANLSALRHAMGTNATRASAAKTAQAQKTKGTAAKENDSQAAVKANCPTLTKGDLNNGNRQNMKGQATKIEKQLKSDEQQGITMEEEKSDGAGETLAPTRYQKNTRDSPASSSSDVSLENGRESHVDNKSLVAAGQFNKALLNVEEYIKEKGREDDATTFPDQMSYPQGVDSHCLKRFSAELDLLSSPLDNKKRAEAFLGELLKTTSKSEIALNKKKEQAESGQTISDTIDTVETGCQTDFARFCPSKSIKATRVIQLQQLKQQQQQLQQQHNQLQQQHQQNLAALQQSGWTNKQQAVPIGMPTRQRKKATAKKTMQQQIQQQQQLQQQQLQQQFQQQQMLDQQQYSLVIPKASPRQSMVGTGGSSVIDGASMTTIQQDSLSAAGMQHFHPPPIGGTVFGGDLKFGSTAPSQIDVNLAAFSAELEMKGKLHGEAAMIAQQGTTEVGCTPHYIEEWLRLSAQTNNFNFNYDSSGKQFINALNDGSGGAAVVGSNLDSAAAVNMQVLEGIMQQPTASMNDVNAALGIIGFDCNMKKLSQKMSQFLDCVESSGNLRDLRACMERLSLSIGEEYNEAYADESISVISVGDGVPRERTYPVCNDEDAQDFADFGVSDVAITNRLNAIIYQLAGSVSLVDLVSRVENRLKELQANEKELTTSHTHAKEKETLLFKQISDLQKNLQTANERNEKLNQQIKDRKNEIKKLEKKAKSEAAVSAENLELHDKVDTLKKELAAVQSKLNEEMMKYRRETQSLADSKKHLQTESNNRLVEIQKLNGVLEEKTQALKKSETQLSAERRSNNSTVAGLTERAKKAEINILELKLEDACRLLERAREDTLSHIKTLGDGLKLTYLTTDEFDRVKKSLREWEDKRDECTGLINQVRSEFTGHIGAIKNGKQLSQLPKIQVPKPPPCPQIYHIRPPPSHISVSQNVSPMTSTSSVMSAFQEQKTAVAAAAMLNNSNNSASGVPPSPFPLERKAITPPSNRARLGAAIAAANIIGTPHAAAMSATSMGSNFQSSMGSVGSVNYTGSNSGGCNSSNPTPIKNIGMPPPNNMMHFQHQQQHQYQQQHQSNPLSSSGISGNSTIAPIGVRPQNYQNGLIHQKSMMPTSTQQHQLPPYYLQNSTRQSPALSSASSIMTSHLNQQQHAALPTHSSFLSQSAKPGTSNTSNNSNNGFFHTWGSSGWGGVEQLNNLNELLGQGRSFGPLGSEFGGSSTTRSDGTNANSNGGNGVINDGNVFFPKCSATKHQLYFCL